jgi:hypothetical protein
MENPDEVDRELDAFFDGLSIPSQVEWLAETVDSSQASLFMAGRAASKIKAAADYLIKDEATRFADTVLSRIRGLQLMLVEMWGGANSGREKLELWHHILYPACEGPPLSLHLRMARTKYAPNDDDLPEGGPHREYWKRLRAYVEAHPEEAQPAS